MIDNQPDFTMICLPRSHMPQAGRDTRSSGLRPLQVGDHVLVIRPGALGDTILSLPSLQVMRERVGSGGRIDWVGYPTPSRLAISPLHADCLHSIDGALFAGLFSGEETPDILEFFKPFDVVVAWCADETGCLSRLFEGMALPFVQARAFPSGSARVHAARHLMRSLEPLGVITPTPLPELVLSVDCRSMAQKLLLEASLEPDRFVAIHPGSGSPRKNWDSEKFAELAKAARQNGLGVLVLEGEADQEAVQRLQARVSESLPVVKGLDLMTLAALLTRSHAYVGNDSGITHLAAAVKVPTYALFGPTDPVVWAPLGLRVHVLPFETQPNEVCNAILKDSSL